MQAIKNRILAELPPQLLNRPRLWLFSAVAIVLLTGVVAATAVVPFSPPPVATRPVVEVLPPPVVSASADNGLPFVREIRIQPGETMHALARRLEIDDAEALAFIGSTQETRQALRQLRAGRSITAVVHADGRLLSISLPVSATERLVIARARGETDFSISRSEVSAADTVVEMRSGVIRSSLFAATDAAELPDAIANKLVDLFGTEIDFHSDLRKGDRFSVIYEAVHDRGARIGTGRVLAAEFINQDKRHLVVLHQNGKEEQYYSADGRSLRQAFLRSPLEFSRVTSSFGQRLHPIHNDRRDHHGVDFGAPTGTPVKATSDGTVDFVGSRNGYGNMVVLRHRGKVSTVYAHLNGFAARLKRNQAVSQGELIGYVGSTGWATGPHLHYEVRIDDRPQDPMRMALPMAAPLAGRELDTFRRATGPLLERFALLNNRESVVASSR